LLAILGAETLTIRRLSLRGRRDFVAKALFLENLVERCHQPLRTFVIAATMSSRSPFVYFGPMVRVAARLKSAIVRGQLAAP
jgi:hypothetical protein